MPGSPLQRRLIALEIGAAARGRTRSTRFGRRGAPDDELESLWRAQASCGRAGNFSAPAYSLLLPDWAELKSAGCCFREERGTPSSIE